MSAITARLTDELDSMQRTTWKQRAIAVEAAVAANAVILLVARLIAGEYPQAKVGDGEQAIGFLPVILTTATAGLLAWGLLALLERITSHARAIWTVVAVGVFLLSLTGPLGNGVDTYARVTLGMMHVAAAAIIIPLLRRSTD
jgi:hypothetical protein